MRAMRGKDVFFLPIDSFCKTVVGGIICCLENSLCILEQDVCFCRQFKTGYCGLNDFFCLRIAYSYADKYP
jgi:hypothetical protein